MLALLAATALLASPGEPTEPAAEPHSPDDVIAEAEHDDAVRAGSEVSAAEAQRVKRIALTLGGGAIGIVAPLGIAWSFHVRDRCPSGRLCTDQWVGIAASVTPFLFALGVLVPHVATGGRAGLGFGLTGALGGYMAALSALGIISIISNKFWADTIAVAGGGLLAGLSVVGGVIGMEWRHSELEAGAAEWSVGRAFAAGAAFWVPFTLVQAGVTALSFGVFYRDSGALIALMTVGTVLNIVGATLAGWGVHVAMGGHAKVWAPLAGMVLAGALGLVFVGLQVPGPPAGGFFAFRSTASMPIAAVACMITVAGPSVALEWGHARYSLDAPREREPVDGQPDPAIQVQLGPAPGGGAVLGLSGTF